MFPILWEILTAGQKLLNGNVLRRDLQSSQSSKANIILATSETTRGAWEKNGIIRVQFLLPIKQLNILLLFEEPPEMKIPSEFQMWRMENWPFILRRWYWSQWLVLSLRNQLPYYACIKQALQQARQHQQDHLWLGADSLCFTSDIKLYICQNFQMLMEFLDHRSRVALPGSELCLAW